MFWFHKKDTGLVELKVILNVKQDRMDKSSFCYVVEKIVLSENGSLILYTW